MTTQTEHEDLSDFQFLNFPASFTPTVFADYTRHVSGQIWNNDSIVTAAIRKRYPAHTLTSSPLTYCNPLAFAAAGYAQAELDVADQEVQRFRIYVPDRQRDGGGRLADSVSFGKYKYTWKGLEFIVYVALFNTYILFPPDDDEEVMGHSKAADALMEAIGSVQFKVEKGVLVFNGFAGWLLDHKLWLEVQKSSWSDVILGEAMKKTLTRTVTKFFDSEKDYLDLGVPWKRGLIFYGPAGNGKTISLKALMHDLSIRDPPIRTLYVKSIAAVYHISYVFQLARQLSPCLLILEDIDSLINRSYQSYFFNEVDGLENNDGILMIATTNHLEDLDGGLPKRPSRFDRKYKFDVPNQHERELYAQYWQRKLKEKKIKVDFPDEICPAFAKITNGFSFAYMKEAFVASLLQLARHKGDDDDDDDSIGEAIEEDALIPLYPSENGDEGEDGNLKHNKFWIELQQQVKVLRRDIDEAKSKFLRRDLALQQSQHQAAVDTDTSIQTSPLQRGCETGSVRINGNPFGLSELQSINSRTQDLTLTQANSNTSSGRAGPGELLMNLSMFNILSSRLQNHDHQK